MNLKSNSPLVKHWTQLRKEKSYREETKKVLVIGEMLASELNLPIERLISTQPVNIKAKESYIVAPEILKKITGFENTIAAEMALPQPSPIEHEKFILILDGIQDPGNLGTLLRTAWALQWEAVFLTPGTVDPFNDKALRASQGAIFHMPFATKSSQEIIEWLEEKKMPLWVADAKGSSLSKLSFKAPLALVLSHEGQGVRSWAKAKGQLIAIPLANKMESLNVSSAGAILLYSLRNR